MNNKEECIGEPRTIQKAFELACNLISELYIKGDVYSSLDKTMPKNYTEDSAWIEYFTDLAKEVEAFNNSRVPQTSNTCPFCGGSKLVYMVSPSEIDDTYDNDEGIHYSVVCDMGQGGCGGSSGYYLSKEKAIEAWERRERS